MTLGISVLIGIALLLLWVSSAMAVSFPVALIGWAAWATALWAGYRLGRVGQ